MALHRLQMLWKALSPRRSSYEAVRTFDHPDDAEDSLTNMKLHPLSSSKPLSDSGESHKWRQPSRQAHCIRWIFMIGVVSNLVLLGLNLWVLDRRVFGNKRYTLDTTLPRTSFYSPLLQGLDLGLHIETINGSLFDLPHDNPAAIYRQPPSPAVDAAWERLAKIRWILIERADVLGLGKDPSLAVRAPQSWSVGEKYISQIDGQHQLHCLNEVRMAAYFWYYHPDDEKRHPLYWTHVSHCIDILRQNLVCQANVDLVTMNWVQTQRNPYPDFSVSHMCRDHEALLEWQEENRVRVDELPWFEKPADANELPIHKDYFKFFPPGRHNGETDVGHSHNHAA